jgi:hypothetical protein
VSAAVVFAADAAYFPLVKGLILSLIEAAPTSRPDYVFLDIGATPAQRAWIAAQGVRLVDGDAIDRAIDLKPAYQIAPYMRAQLVRPFLPQLLPDHECLIWLDADLWVQDPAAINMLVELIAAHPQAMAIAPLIDTCYWTHYKPAEEIRVPIDLWYRGLFGAAEAAAHGGKCIFSSGVFAAGRDSPVWQRWREALARAISNPLSEPVLRHLAEQTALNLVLHEQGGYLPLGSWFNYNLHLGAAILRPADDRVVRGLPPFEAVGVIHLSDFRLRAAQYRDQKLLYRGGDYLDETDREALARLSPHL